MSTALVEHGAYGCRRLAPRSRGGLELQHSRLTRRGQSRKLVACQVRILITSIHYGIRSRAEFPLQERIGRSEDRLKAAKALISQMPSERIDVLTQVLRRAVVTETNFLRQWIFRQMVFDSTENMGVTNGQFGGSDRAPKLPIHQAQVEFSRVRSTNRIQSIRRL